MAISNFYMDYEDGFPPINQTFDVEYFNPETNDVDGYISPLEEVTGTQAHVKVQVKSSVEKLTLLKSDSRCEWIEDVDWTSA